MPVALRGLLARPLRLALTMAGAGAVAVLAAGCSPIASTQAAPGTIGVVAGENFWGDILKQIGGTHVTVTSIISDPNADPHEYATDAADAQAIAGAKLVVENGFGYDDFMSKLLDASPNSGRQVLSVQTILHITGDDPNPHIWYDTARLPEVADAFAAELGRLDPGHRAEFNANAKTFEKSLAPIEQVIGRIRAKYSGTEIAYTERVPGYLVDAAGLKLGVPVRFTQSIEDGTDPAPADTAAFDRAITSKTVKVLLYNGQVTDAQTTKIKQLATAAGVPIVGVTETLPSRYSTFQAWQLAQADQLLAALQR